MTTTQSCYHSPCGVDWRIAALITSRKVRTLTGSRLANGQARRRDGKCNREYTAHRLDTARFEEEARVKRCGKSAPRPTRVGAARQTPCGARPNREVMEPPVSVMSFRVGCLTGAVTRPADE